MKRFALLCLMTLLPACGGMELEGDEGESLDAAELETPQDNEALATASQSLANGPCGDSYRRLVRHVAIGDLAHLDVYYSPSKNRYCAVNMATSETWNEPRGRALRVLEGRNPSRREEVGRFRFYAGPIYVSRSPGGCVRLTASVQASPTSALGIGSSARICD